MTLFKELFTTSRGYYAILEGLAVFIITMIVCSVHAQDIETGFFWGLIISIILYFTLCFPYLTKNVSANRAIILANLFKAEMRGYLHICPSRVHINESENVYPFLLVDHEMNGINLH